MKKNRSSIRRHMDVVTKYFYPVAAGIETNIMETYARLTEAGWDITIHTSRDEYLVKNSLPELETIRGLRIKRYTYRSDFMGFIPDIQWDTTDVVALHNFNVFFWHILLRAFIERIFKKNTFSLIVTPHGGFTPEWSLYNPLMNTIKQPFHRFIGVPALNYLVDGIRAVSEWEKIEMKKSGLHGSNISVIPNGLEDEAFRPIDKLASAGIRNLTKKYTPYILQIGRIYPVKNYETVIRALPMMPSDITYIIAGQEEKNTTYKESLISLATELGVANRVRFVGVIRGVDKYYLIRHALAMTHMAIWESFCNVVHEAMSQGTTCIVADNTALPLLIQHEQNGFVIPTHDSEKLAKTVTHIYNHADSDRIHNMNKKNIKLCSDETWLVVASKYDSMLRRSMNKYE